MKECSTEHIDMLFTELSHAPDSQIDENTKNMIFNFKGTYAEKYDFIVGVSKLDLCKISSFVRELCALDRYYLRPNI